MYNIHFQKTKNDSNSYSIAIVFDGKVTSPLFHYENNTTGEMFFMERRIRAWEERYILRHCHKTDLTTVDQFYNEAFSKSGWYHSTKRGDKPILIIIE